MNQKSPLKVVVLAGGASPERNVSLASGDAVFQALMEAGHQPVRVDPGAPGKVYLPDEMFIPGDVGHHPPEMVESDLTPDQTQEFPYP